MLILPDRLKEIVYLLRPKPVPANVQVNEVPRVLNKGYELLEVALVEPRVNEAESLQEGALLEYLQEGVDCLRVDLAVDDSQLLQVVGDRPVGQHRRYHVHALQPEVVLDVDD